MDRNIAAQRLWNHQLHRPLRGTPARVVERLGAVQAQEYPFAKWALALRLAGETADAEIEQAFDAGRILRTHVLRPTWHFVTPADIGWMLELTRPRVHSVLACYTRRRGIDPRTLSRATALFERALGGGHHLTRAELGARLASARMTLGSLELALVTMYAELEGVICSGSRRGKQFTYALLSERAPGGRRLSRDESLEELTRRYFSSHGPATIRDFVWWSSLTAAEARRGLEIIRARPRVHDGLTYWGTGRVAALDPAVETVRLLPVYDEYLVSYRDRVAVPHRSSTVHAGSAAVSFRHALVIAGEVAGTWNTRAHHTGIAMNVTPSRRLTRAEQIGVEAAAARYSRFLGRQVSLTIA